MGDFDYYVSEDDILAGLAPVFGKYAVDADDGIVPMLRDAFAAGFDAGCRALQYEWEQAEELRAESEAGWDW